jgi:hypothetical protein
MLYILDSMEELKLRLLSDDFGKHLMGVEDLLQKHSLVEADINVLGERVKQVVQHSQRFLGKRNQMLHLNQCCGSGSGIRCLFDPWNRNPEWVFSAAFQKFNNFQFCEIHGYKKGRTINFFPDITGLP